MNFIPAILKQSISFSDLIKLCLVVLFFCMDILFYKALADHVAYVLVIAFWQLHTFWMILLEGLESGRNDQYHIAC